MSNIIFFGKQITDMFSSSIGKFLNAFKHLCYHLLLILLNSNNFLNVLECFKISFTEIAVAPLLITLQPCGINNKGAMAASIKGLEQKRGTL